MAHAHLKHPDQYESPGGEIVGSEVHIYLSTDHRSASNRLVLPFRGSPAAPRTYRVASLDGPGVRLEMPVPGGYEDVTPQENRGVFLVTVAAWCVWADRNVEGENDEP